MERPEYKHADLEALKKEIENDTSVTLIAAEHPENLGFKYAAAYGCLCVKAAYWKRDAEYYKALAEYYEYRINKAEKKIQYAIDAEWEEDRDIWLEDANNTLKNSIK